jgi:hypothetical protein
MIYAVACMYHLLMRIMSQVALAVTRGRKGKKPGIFGHCLHFFIYKCKDCQSDITVA